VTTLPISPREDPSEHIVLIKKKKTISFHTGDSGSSTSEASIQSMLIDNGEYNLVMMSGDANHFQSRMQSSVSEYDNQRTLLETAL
jgi:hypothetical protein